MKEVLRSEAGIELIIEDEARPEKQKKKPGVSGQGRRVTCCQLGGMGKSHRKVRGDWGMGFGTAGDSEAWGT